MDEKSIGQEAAAKALAAQGIGVKTTPEIPHGFALVPTDKVDRLVDASKRLKGIRGLVDAAKSDPAVLRGVEDLGREVSGLAASVIGSDESSETEQTPTENQSILILLALGAVGGLLLLRQKKQEEAEAAAVQAQQAMLTAQEAEKIANWAILGGSSDNNTGVKPACADSGGSISGLPLHREG